MFDPAIPDYLAANLRLVEELYFSIYAAQLREDRAVLFGQHGDRRRGDRFELDTSLEQMAALKPAFRKDGTAADTYPEWLREQAR